MLIGFIARRIFAMIPTLLAVSLLVFVVVKSIPGDPAQMLLGDRASPEALATLRQEMGLDKPLVAQYFVFMQQLLIEGDFGRSLVSSEPISQILMEKFPATLELALSAIFIAVLIGVPLGIVAALRRGSWLDFTAVSTAVFGVSMPVFWLGLILIWVFGLELNWLPLSGRIGVEYSYEPITGLMLLDALLVKNYELFWSSLSYLILPSITLATIPMAFIARMTRASMLDVLKDDYVRTARAKGVKEISVVLKHALRNSLPNIITIVGLQLGALLAGAMITETVFSWPGMGTWILESVAARDIPALEVGVLLVAFLFMLINLAVDLTSAFLDPRIRA